MPHSAPELNFLLLQRPLLITLISFGLMGKEKSLFVDVKVFNLSQISDDEEQKLNLDKQTHFHRNM